VKVLALDTSSPTTAVAIVDGQRVLAEDDSASEERHGAVLLPRIEAQLHAAGLPLQALELIAVGLGPGSFTGLRVGVATAKGLALATSLPVRGVSTLEALALPLLEHAERALVVLDAGRDELYAAAYARAGARPALLLPPLRAPLPDLLGHLSELTRVHGAISVCGDGARLHAHALADRLGTTCAPADRGCDRPRGRYVARAAIAAFVAEGASDLATLEPTYLRDSDAKLPDEPLAI